jgi:hypothetical protein
MAALKPHNLFPFSVSDTRPGLMLSILPISACDILGLAFLIALIFSLNASVIEAEVGGTLCPDGRRAISPAKRFSSSQSNCKASSRNLAATSGSLIAFTFFGLNRCECGALASSISPVRTDLSLTFQS